MKKLLITLGLLTITVLPVLATNWVLIDPEGQMHIDTTSISKYKPIYGRNNIYSIWLKDSNNNDSLDQKISISVGNFNYVLQMSLIDCNTKEIANKSVATYDFNGSIITNGSYTKSDYQLEWEPIIPGSVGEFMYNYACGGDSK